MTESVFKRRKRRGTGVYTDPGTRIAVKYANDVTAFEAASSTQVPESSQSAICPFPAITQDNSNAMALESLTKNVSDVWFKMDYLWKENKHEKHQSFAESVWNLARGLPDSQIFVNALKTKENNLTWMDLSSACPANVPSAKKPRMLADESYPPGWLTTDIVQAYAMTSVMQVNALTGTTPFACGNGDLALDILKGKTFRDPLRACSSFSSTGNIVDMPDNVIFPILWNRDFVLLVLQGRGRKVTLYNSQQSTDPGLVVAITEHFIPFFRKFLKEKEFSYFEEVIFKQEDSSGCGVCVCLTIDQLCFGKNVARDRPDLQTMYRHWILCKVIGFSIKVSSDIIRIARKTLTVPELASTLENKGNTCWLNASLQAISTAIGVLEISDIDSCLFSSLTRHISRILQLMQSMKPVPGDLLRVTSDLICRQKNWELGNQHDAGEFMVYLLTDDDFDSALQAVGISTRCRSQAFGIPQTQFDVPILICPVSESCAGKTIKDVVLDYLKTMTAPYDATITTGEFPYPELLAINLARGGSGIKSFADIHVTKTLSLKSTVEECEYILKCVVVHLGERIEEGHYICYKVLSHEYVLLCDDSNVEVVPWNQIEKTIEKQSVVILYQKCTRKRKKSMSRRDHQPPQISSERLEYVTKVENYIPLFLTNDSCVKARLFVVMQNLESCAMFSFQQAMYANNGLRHCLFLKEKFSTLKLFNAKICFDKIMCDPSVLMDLLEHVKGSFCKHVVTIPKTSSGIELPAKPVKHLTFNPNIFSQNTELGRMFEDSKGTITAYLKEVVFFEASIYYIMVDGGSYEKASETLGFAPTSYDEIQKKNFRF